MGLYGGGGLKSLFNVGSLLLQDIVAKSISLTQASGSIAVQLVTGARLKLGTGTTDYLTSTGTTGILAGGNLGVNAGNRLSYSGASVGFVDDGTNCTTEHPLLLSAGGSYKVVSQALIATAPTISAGFGAGAAIVASNGACAFTVNTGAASATGTIGLPTAANGWVVLCNNITTNDANHASTKMTSSTTTTAVIGNFTSGGVSGNWAANDIIACVAIAF